MSEITNNEDEEFRRIEMQKICEEILSFAPSCEEVEDFIDSIGKSDFVTFTDDNEPLTIQVVEKTHINIVICNIHLTLDEVVAPIFLAFITNKRKRK